MTERRTLFVLIAAASIVAACGSTTSTSSSDATDAAAGDPSASGVEQGGAPAGDSYTARMESICEATESSLDALPDPPEAISTVDFAAEVNSLLGSEAEAMRAVDPDRTTPTVSGSDPAADHRALIANTEAQAAAWDELSDAVAAGTDIADLRTTIGELTLGRDDLVTAMGIPGCARGT